MTRTRLATFRRRMSLVVRRRTEAASDLGQAALVAVIAFAVLASLIGAVLVQTVANSDPLLQAKAVEIYAHRALQAGQNAFLTGVNANPSLAQCTTNTNNSGTCGGIDYGQWNVVTGSNASGADLEYYAFGNPQPVFDPTTNALTSLTVQVVGAAYDPSATNHYLFDQESVSVTPSNGFLQNVWWSNYESYNANGDYSTCNYNWKVGYNINNAGLTCSPVYFGPNDYLFGPVYTNDSVFVSPSPAFGTPAAPSTVTTADTGCLFVDDAHGMSGGANNCVTANNDVATYATGTSAHSHAVEQPPANDTQLGTIAKENGCLYSGPTQITLSKDTNPSDPNYGAGLMTVTSPDTTEGTQTINGTTYTWDTNNIPSNVNNCPNNGQSALLPANGVVFVQNAGGVGQAWANPYDDATYSTVTNLTSSPAAPLTPRTAQPVTLTATVTSGTNLIPNGSTVAFSQTTSSGTSVIGACSAVALGSATAVAGSSPTTYTATATCPTTEASNSTGAFSAAYSAGTNTTASSANLGQTYRLSSTTPTWGPDAQTTAGGCSACYYGQTGTPDAEGDAFVNGSLSGQLTIGTANNVVIDGSITYADCATTWTTGQSGSSAPSQGLCPYNTGGTNDVLGLIANNYAEINHPVIASSTTGRGTRTVEPFCGATPGATCDPSDGTHGITVDAAVLALNQSFVVNNYGDDNSEGPLIVYGSIQQYARGPVGTFSGSTLNSGFQKHYTWDPLLTFVSPPSYLVPTTPSWVLASVTTNAGVAPTNVCPPLLGPYAGIVNGVAQTGPAIAQYCSAAPPTGLPNYPASTVPSPPTAVSATANPDGTVTVNWTDPPSNGPTITGYGISSSPPCPSCSYSSLSGASVASTSVTGLTPGSTYTFQVTATNSSGTSNPSTASNSVVVPNVPSVPSGVSAQANPNGTVTVNWTDPAANGSPITGYAITPNPACATCTYTNLSGANVTSATISGLTPLGTYTFSVNAINLIGPGNSSAASNSVVVPSVPGAPTIGTATPGASSAVLTWSAPSTANGSAITGYVVTPYVLGVAQTPQTFTSTATTQTVTGLVNGSPYTFTVAAINGVGTGPASGSSNSVTPATIPGAPTIGSVTRGNTTVTVTWAPPSSNGGATITGYTVTPYIGGVAQTPQTFSSAATTETVTGLTNGTAYTFTVAAINWVGTGPQSSASASVTPATTPGVPTIGTATVSIGSATVTWTAPASNGGSPITGYTVTPYIGGVAQTPQTFSSTATSETLTGLSNGTAYTFTVAAINAVGTGGASSNSNSVTTPSAPGAPTSVVAVANADGTVTVTWTDPANNGAAITGYTVNPSPSCSGCTYTNLSGASITSTTITSLTPGASYTFTVSATNGVGTGPASAASGSVTVDSVAGAPTIGTVTAGNASATVTWTAPSSNGGSPITGYQVTPYIAGVAQTPQIFSSTATTEVATGLTNGTAYTFRVAAINGVGTSPQSAASASVTPVTTPGAPTIGTVTRGNASVTVTWTAPGSTGGSPITGYKVTPYIAGVAQAVQTFASTATSEVATGLTNGTAYTFTVAATNAVGTGSASAASASVTPATNPGAPTIGTVTRGNASVTVTWTAPGSTGGSPVTGYTVTPYIAGVAQTPQVFASTATSEVATGLTNGTAYTFTVAATNAVGTGAASAASASVTPATTPGAPTIGTATSNGSGKVTVTWTAPGSTGGSPITGYTVTPYIGGSAQTAQSFASTAISEQLTGLSVGTTYTFKVAATNAVGTGSQSASSPSVRA